MVTASTKQAVWVSASVAVVALVIAVIANARVPSAYDGAAYPAWAAGVAAAPDAAAVAAWAFAFGLAATAPFYFLVVPEVHPDRRAWAVAGAAPLAVVAVADGVFSLLPWAIAVTPALDGPTAEALLALTFAVDAFHNAFVGVGLVALAVAFQRTAWASRALVALTVVAGVGMGVAGFQAVVPVTAFAVYVAGWLWLAWFLAVAWALHRAPSTQRAWHAEAVESDG